MKLRRKNHSKILVFLILLILFSFIRFKIIQNNSRDLAYSVERYLTSSIFNLNKLHHIDSLHMTFSDGKLAVVQVDGKEKKSPHKKVKYDVLVQKNSKGIWKVKKLYQIP